MWPGTITGIDIIINPFSFEIFTNEPILIFTVKNESRKAFASFNIIVRTSFLTFTRPLRRKLRNSADASLIRQKIGTFLYKMMWIKIG